MKYRIICTRPTVYGIARVASQALLGGAYGTTFETPRSAALVAKELEKRAKKVFGLGWFFEVEEVLPQEVTT